MSSPTPIEIQPILLACAPDELHEGSLLIFSALLRRCRYPVLYLGQAVLLVSFRGRVFTRNPEMREKHKGFYLENDFREDLHNIEKIVIR